MKKIILLTIVGLCFLSAKSQSLDLKNINEVYISSSSLIGSNFGLQFKSGLSEKSLFTISLLNLSSFYQNISTNILYSIPRSNLVMDIGFNVGLERRKSITETMTLFYGISALLNSEMISVNRKDPIIPEDLQTMNSYEFKPGIGLNAGMILQISKDFYFAAEINPCLFFNHITSEAMGDEGSLEKNIYTKKEVEFDLNTESLRLSIVYRWHKNS